MFLIVGSQDVYTEFAEKTGVSSALQLPADKLS
jgi:hypothetical protein